MYIGHVFKINYNFACVSLKRNISICTGLLTGALGIIGTAIFSGSVRDDLQWAHGMTVAGCALFIGFGWAAGLVERNCKFQGEESSDVTDAEQATVDISL